MDDDSIKVSQKAGAVDVRSRRNDQKTESESFDVSSLPKIMQLRRGQWGMKGQTKYTHLVDQDTTDKRELSAEAAGVGTNLTRMAGTGDLNRAGKRQKR